MTVCRRLCAVLCLLSIWITRGVSAAEPDDPRPVYECERAAKAIDPDGGLQQFEGAPRLYMRDESMIHGVGWKGVDDLSVTLRLRFDETNLYLLVEAMDNDLQWPPEENEYLWSYDSVQIGFDPKFDGGLSGYGPEDSEYLFTQLDGKPVVWRRHATEGTRLGRAEGIAAKIDRHPTMPGWYALIAMPWKELGVASPAIGTKFGFNVLVNDKDSARDRLFIEWTPGIGFSKKPSSFGEIRLVEKATRTETEAAGTGKPELRPDRWAEKMLDISDSPDEAAFGGSAKGISEPGVYCWWILDESLMEGTYRLHARVKGAGTLSMKLIDHSSGKEVLSLPGAAIASENYRLYDVGTFTYNGKYPLRLADWSTGGLTVDYVALTSETKLTPEIAARRSERVIAGAAKLEALLNQAKAAGIDVRDESITHATAVLFAGYGADDAVRGKMRRADRVLKYVEAAVPRAVEAVQAKVAAGEPKARPAVDVRNLTVRDGYFHSGDRPVFLWGAIDAPPEWAPKLGFNYAYFWSPLEKFYSSMEAINPEHLAETLDRLREYRRAGLAVSFLVGMHYFPSGFYRDHPETRHVGQGKSFVIPCVESELTRKALSVFYRKVAPAMHGEGLLDIELANELGYACRCEQSTRMFREYLRRQYGSDDALSKSWGKPARIDEAALPEETATGAQGFDWHDFNQSRVVEAFKFISDQATTAAPGLHTDIKVVAGRVFDGSDLTWGIDHELLAQTTTITGQDSYFSEAGLPRAMMYDLYRAFANGRCIVDHECAYIRPGATAAEVRLNLWVSAAHGEAGAAMYIWDRNELTPDVQDCIATQPWSVEMMGQTIRRINDVAPEMVAIANAPTEVRILYSRSSGIQAPHEHLPRMVNFYKAAAFIGAPIGFVTERQLAGGVPQGTKVIIVPAAKYLPAEAIDGLRRFAASGGRVGIIGECGTHTERAVARPESDTQTFLSSPTVGKLERNATREQIARYFAQADVDLCLGAAMNLEARRVSTETGELRIYINYGRTDQTVAIPDGAIDVVTGMQLTNAQVPAHSATLIRLPAVQHK